MTSLIQRLSLVAAAAVVTIALSAAVSSPSNAMGIDEPAKPAGAPTDKKDDTKDAKPATGTKAPDAKPADAKPADTKPADKKSDLDFRDGYKLAYDAIYRHQDYARGIVILSALGHDSHPDVANLIGFASRKLGRTEDAKVWYEKALAADPKHTRTWQYYGMWHLERGDRAKAQQHLERIQLICGQGCEDYTSLRDALNGNASY
jgi:tetratricopeptide (TPR) repeat protein